MRALAQLCCVVLMLLGLFFIGCDIVTATGGRPFTFVPARHLCLWQWGIAAVFAGVVGTALLNIADGLAHRGGVAPAARPEPKSE